MKEPTLREKMADTMRRRNAYIEAHALDRFEDLPEELESEFLKVRARAFCAYPNCRKPWLLTEEKSPLKACSKCKWAYYCSVRVFSFFLLATKRSNIVYVAQMSEEGLGASQERALLTYRGNYQR